ncbi:IscS subfamily cysteine desulfurase [Pueribacillus sp. YX66]|uniref:IscS subfamily cysteine desulfurase n=1 Tax=Pueribacillus sp. YX66 TaxID=3229242 RepID=UPI00358D16F9
MIYLDYAATTPMSEEALDAYTEAAKKFYGNPSSLHDIGSEAENMLEVCRTQLAHMINGEAEGVYFTSGGTESNILAIRSLVTAHKYKGNHIITTKVEHSSLYQLFKLLETEGFEVTYLGVDEEGQIDMGELKATIRDDTILASIHHVNSEIGTIQRLHEIGELLEEEGVLFHSDCVQSFGKLAIDVKKYKLDSLSVSSHKLYGPKGVGMCYINPIIRWAMQLPNTTHERGFRPGTVNVPGVVSFTMVAQLAMKNIAENFERESMLRNRFLFGIKKIDYEINVEGHSIEQLPSIIGLSISGIQGQYMMLEFNRHGIAISTGSACQVGQQEPSRTMLALGKTDDEAKQFIRISFGRFTDERHIEKAISVLKNIIKQF